VDPALAYGPDDPAYGPPAPGWYKRDEESAPRAEDGEPPADPDESRAARGPFEPLRPGGREETGPAGYQQADGGAALDDPDAGQPETGAPEYEPIDYELPELFDFGTPTDPEAGAIGELKDLYQTAETAGQSSLDRHFDQLLERQRQLISEYFEESGALGPAGPVPPVVVTPGAADPANSAVPFGFDTAASLAALRGELRGAQ
jgi:hypothetical protein